MTRILRDLSDIKLGFGGASISGEGAGYGFGDISKDDSLELLKFVKERGVKVFDTAPIYGFGESEVRMGEAFKSCREEVFIVSKSGVSWHSTKRVNMTNEPKETQKMLHESLKRLQSEYIDLYMIHWPDKRVDIRRPMEVLAKAKNEGKIKHIGLCNTNRSDYLLASEIENIEVIQGSLNFFDRESLDDVIPLAQKENLSFMSWGTLDKGLLSGTVTKNRTFDKSDCRSWAPWWKAIPKEEKIKKAAIIQDHLKSVGKSALNLALTFNSSIESVDSVLCGGRSIEQWQGLLDAYLNPLTEQELKSIDELIK
jgi:aryl-alcohol dehydrogenase-like predicted oxidoreductase